MVEEPQLPPIAEMLRWIEDVVAQGIRRPGYPADRWAEDFIHRAFGSLGLEGATAKPDRSRSDRSSASVMFVMTLVEQKMPHSMQSPLHVFLLLKSLRPLLGIQKEMHVIGGDAVVQKRHFKLRQVLAQHGL